VTYFDDGVVFFLNREQTLNNSAFRLGHLRDQRQIQIHAFNLEVRNDEELHAEETRIVFNVLDRQVVSLFANEGGMKLIAAQGNNEIQAQHGNIECTAAENIRVSASNGNVEVSAKDSLTLRCGGAEIKLQGGNIELSCPGDVKLNCITLQKGGPGSVAGLSASFDLLSCMSALKRVASTGGAFA
jgi:hypothetical protein